MSDNKIMPENIKGYNVINRIDLEHIQIKKDELLLKLKDMGIEDKYIESIYYRNTIDNLSIGINPIDVIFQLLNIIEQQNELTIKILNKQMIDDEMDNIKTITSNMIIKK